MMRLEEHRPARTLIGDFLEVLLGILCVAALCGVVYIAVIAPILYGGWGGLAFAPVAALAIAIFILVLIEDGI